MGEQQTSRTLGFRGAQQKSFTLVASNHRNSYTQRPKGELLKPKDIFSFKNIFVQYWIIKTEVTTHASPPLLSTQRTPAQQKTTTGLWFSLHQPLTCIEGSKNRSFPLPGLFSIPTPRSFPHVPKQPQSANNLNYTIIIAKTHRNFSQGINMKQNFCLHCCPKIIYLHTDAQDHDGDKLWGTTVLKSFEQFLARMALDPNSPYSVYATWPLRDEITPIRVHRVQL